MGSFALKTESTSYTPQEARQTRLIVMSANNARQKDAAFLPTTADMSSPQTNEAGVTAESASPALSHGHSTAAESMDTNHGDLGVMVTNRPVPSPLPALIEEQARQSPEIRIESLQRDELETPSHTPQEVRETHDIILSANNARQTDAALPTTADMSSPQTHEAGATLQPAESASCAFSSGHSTAVESIGTDIGNLRRRAALPFPSIKLRMKMTERGRPYDIGHHFKSKAFATRVQGAADEKPSAISFARSGEDSLEYAQRLALACVIPLPVPGWSVAHNPDSPQQDERNKLAFLLRDYLQTNPEPIVGSPDNPFPSADVLGIRNTSVLSAFIEHADMETFTCTFCGDVQTNVEASLTHQRTFLQSCSN